jgi:TonB family protein
MSPVDTNAKAPPELDLLLGQEPVSSRHLVAMALASIAVHIVAIAFFLSLPEVIPPPRKAIITSDLHRAVHLILPRAFEPTQKAPNLTKVVRSELDVRSEVEAPQSQAPKFRPPQPAPGPVAQPIPPPAPTPVIEPPKIQVAAAQPTPLPPTIAPPPPPNGSTPQAPPPPADSKPKMAFENVSPPTVIRVNGPPPDPRLLMHPAPPEFTAPTNRPTGGGGVSVGDTGDDLTLLPGLNQAQSKGRMGSNLQLLSDANGFDFKPYLMQVLSSVRRNWMAVIPQSATMTGRRGSVLIQFIIDRRGGVPKLVIASSSGTEAFDRAAVAGVSASNPFPPLPPEFKGDQIRLQLAFSYNAPHH